MAAESRANGSRHHKRTGRNRGSQDRNMGRRRATTGWRSPSRAMSREKLRAASKALDRRETSPRRGYRRGRGRTAVVLDERSRQSPPSLPIARCRVRRDPRRDPHGQRQVRPCIQRPTGRARRRLPPCRGSSASDVNGVECADRSVPSGSRCRCRCLYRGRMWAARLHLVEVAADGASISTPSATTKRDTMLYPAMVPTSSTVC